MFVCVSGGWVWACPRVCHSTYEGAVLSYFVEAGSVLCILQALRGRSLKFLHSASFTSVQHCCDGRSVPHVAFYQSSGGPHSSRRAWCAERFYPLGHSINCKIKCDLPALTHGEELGPTSTWYASFVSSWEVCSILSGAGGWVDGGGGRWASEGREQLERKKGKLVGM